MSGLLLKKFMYYDVTLTYFHLKRDIVYLMASNMFNIFCYGHEWHRLELPGLDLVHIPKNVDVGTATAVVYLAVKCTFNANVVGSAATSSKLLYRPLSFFL